MTYSALFCSEVNKLYVLLHAKLFSHTRTARWYAAMRAAHHHARTSAAPSVLRWSRWRPALLIYTHLRLQHWDIFSWSIRILRCPWCCFFGSDSDTFLIHKFFGAFLAPPQQLVVGRCWCLLSKGYFITSSVFLAIKKATHFWPESFPDVEIHWERDFIPPRPSWPPWCSWGARRRSSPRRSWTRGKRRRSRSTRTSHPRSSVSAWTCNRIRISIEMKAFLRFNFFASMDD